MLFQFIIYALEKKMAIFENWKVPSSRKNEKWHEDIPEGEHVGKLAITLWDSWMEIMNGDVWQ